MDLYGGGVKDVTSASDAVHGLRVPVVFRERYTAEFGKVVGAVMSLNTVCVSKALMARPIAERDQSSESTRSDLVRSSFARAVSTLCRL